MIGEETIRQYFAAWNTHDARLAPLRRVRISLLSPVLYLAGSAVALIYPLVALSLYALIPAYFALGNLGHKGPPEATTGNALQE